MDVNLQQRVKIDRPLYEQQQLHKEFEYEQPKCSFLDLSLLLCKPTKVLLRTIPILEWLPQYQWRKDFVGDLIAGITVAIMHIPQGMAYSLLGNVPAVVGIYMAFFPVLIYFFLGTSKHNSMGTFAIVCLMTGKVVLEHSNPSYFSHQINHNSTNLITEHEGHSPMEVATIVTFTVSLFQLCMYIFRLGIISTLLSDTLVSGFTTAAAFQVLTSQMKDIFGLKLPKDGNYFVVINTWKNIFGQISEANYIAVIISGLTIAITVFNNEILKPRVAKKCVFPIPIELIVVVIGTFASQYWNLNEDYNISIVGDIPSGLPPPSLPKFSLMSDIVIDSLMIAIVSYALSLSMSLIFAQKLGYEVDANQELLAQGGGNLFGSFFSCMPFCASISRSLIQQTVGGKTQVTSIISCGILVLVLMWIGPFFEPLPKSVLASVIVVALKGMLFQVKDFLHFWKLSKLDACVWLLTFVTVIVISIEIGLLVGLVASLGTIVIMGYKPYTCLLGSVINTDLYLDITRYKMAKELDGIKIYHYRGGINFSSRSMYKSELYKLIELYPQKELILKRKLEKIVAAEEWSATNASIQKLNNKLDKLKSKIKMNLRCLILDFSAVSYIDPSGISMLKLLVEDFMKINITVYIAGCCEPVYETMKKCNLLKDDKNSMRIFPTVHDAVQTASAIICAESFKSICIISQ